MNRKPRVKNKRVYSTDKRIKRLQRQLNKVLNQPIRTTATIEIDTLDGPVRVPGGTKLTLRGRLEERMKTLLNTK